MTYNEELAKVLGKVETYDFRYTEVQDDEFLLLNRFVVAGGLVLSEEGTHRVVVVTLVLRDGCGRDVQVQYAMTSLEAQAMARILESRAVGDVEGVADVRTEC